MRATALAAVVDSWSQPMMTDGERPVEAALTGVGVAVMEELHGGCDSGTMGVCGWKRPAVVRRSRRR